MLNIPAFVAEKNKLYGDMFVLLLEIRYADYSSKEGLAGAGSTTTVIVLGSSVTLVGGHSYTLTINGEVRTVTNGAGTYSTLTVSAAFSAAPPMGTRWILAGDALYVRWAKFPTNVVFEGNTFVPFGIGKVRRSQNSSGEIPTFDIPLTNVGREMQSILSLYIVEDRPGRLITVHRDFLADPNSKHEEPFTIVSASADVNHAVLTCAGVRFDPLSMLIPKKIMTRADYPGLPGPQPRYYR